MCFYLHLYLGTIIENKLSFGSNTTITSQSLFVCERWQSFMSRFLFTLFYRSFIEFIILRCLISFPNC